MRIIIEGFPGSSRAIVVDTAGPMLLLARGASGEHTFVVDAATDEEAIELVARVLAKARGRFGKDGCLRAIRLSDNIFTATVAELGSQAQPGDRT